MFKFVIFLIIAIIATVVLQHTSATINFNYNNILVELSTWKILAGLILIFLLQYYLLKINFILNLNNWRIKRAFFALLKGKIKPVKFNHASLNWAQSLLCLMRSELYYNKNQHKLALQELTELHQKFPNKPLILLRITAIYHALQNWPELIKLLPTLKKHNIYNDFEFQQLEFKVYQARLEQLIKQESIDVSSDFLKQIPKHLRQQAKFILGYINCLLTLKYYDVAENIIRANLNYHKNFDNTDNADLIKLYGIIKSNNIRLQIKSAEQWLAKNPNNFMLLLSLGRLCISECLWGKAKDYLERALLIQEDPDCYAELAKLSKILGGPQINQYNQYNQ